MSDEVYTSNEREAASAFTKQAPHFDEIYGTDEIIRYKRKRVRDHVLRWLDPAASILELNAGTGEDAIFFAAKGHRVHATDISPGMQEILRQKLMRKNLSAKVSQELCSFTCLGELKFRGPYDLIFSNFAGLNCTDQLGTVLDSFNSLLKPGGIVTLVVLPKFCLWESLLIFKGKFRVAFRRIFSSGGAKARVEGQYFKCWYYQPSFIINRLKRDFELLSLEGLCTCVPPSYIQGFDQKYPRLYDFLKAREDGLKEKWPWKFIGDYYIISFRRKD